MSPDEPNPTLASEHAISEAIASAQRRPVSSCQQGEARTVVREVGSVKITHTLDRRPLPQGAV